MNISQLEYFTAVMRAGSINKAAEKIHTSPQNISSGIKRLENDLGYPLFIRNGKQSMSLSVYGEIFAETAAEILKSLDHCQQKMQNISALEQNKKETLRIFASPAANLDILPSVLQLFSQKRPHVKLQTAHEETSVIFSILAEQEAMAFLVNFKPLVDTKQILYKHLFIDKVYAVFSPKHPLAQQKTVSISSILRYPLAIIQSNADCTNPLRTLLEQYGNPDYHIITTNINIYEKAIDNNQAVGFTTKSILKSQTALSELTKNNITVSIKNMPPIYIYLGAGKQYYQKHQRSIDELVEICQSLF